MKTDLGRENNRSKQSKYDNSINGDGQKAESLKNNSEQNEQRNVLSEHIIKDKANTSHTKMEQSVSKSKDADASNSQNRSKTVNTNCDARAEVALRQEIEDFDGFANSSSNEESIGNLEIDEAQDHIDAEPEEEAQ